MKTNRKTQECPDCRSRRLRYAQREEEPDHFVVLKKYLACDSCGAVFQSTSPAGNAVLLVVLGAVTIIGSIIEFLVRPNWTYWAVPSIVLVYGVLILRNGVVGLLHAAWIRARPPEPNHEGRPKEAQETDQRGDSAES